MYLSLQVLLGIIYVGGVLKELVKRRCGSGLTIDSNNYENSVYISISNLSIFTERWANSYWVIESKICSNISMSFPNGLKKGYYK